MSLRRQDNSIVYANNHNLRSKFYIKINVPIQYMNNILYLGNIENSSEILRKINVDIY